MPPVENSGLEIFEEEGDLDLLEDIVGEVEDLYDPDVPLPEGLDGKSTS
jgi:Mg2+/Co2+ transporter CorC